MTEVWPFRPLIGCRETLEWLSEPLTSLTGEQRIALRSAPRQLFEYTFRFNSHEFARARNLARRVAAETVYVPVWGDQVQSANLLDTDTVIIGDMSASDFRAAGDPILVWQDNVNYVVAEIGVLGGGHLELVTPLGIPLIKPAVVPLREAITPTGFAIRRFTSISEISVMFQVQDNIDLAAGYVTDYPQYQGKDVVTERTLMLADVSESIIRPAEYIDNGFGLVSIEVQRNYVDFGQTISFLETRNTALWRRRKWLHSLRGKQKTFWLPTFNNDLELQASFTSGATTISVKSVGPINTYIGKHIMFTLNNGTRYMRSITNAISGVGDNVTLTISSSLGVAVSPVTLEYICFLSLVRLNADKVVLEHQLAIDTTVSAQVMEVPA